MRTRIRLAIMVLLLFFLVCIEMVKCQQFVQVATYSPPLTDIDFDDGGNLYAIRQNGEVYRNNQLILTVPVWNFNEMGLVGLDVVNENIYMHVSGTDTVQRVIKYDTINETFDTLIQVSYSDIVSSVHRGGDILVADSILYCSFGEGGWKKKSQDLSDYRGKILTLNLNTGVIGILGFGLRNPFRFDIDLQNTWGYIGDVGSNICEEVNYFDIYLDTLLNYGWPCFECDYQWQDPDTLCDEYEYVWPVFMYKQNPQRAIIGGAFWHNNWYFCDRYTGFGGYMDSMGAFTQLIIPFPTGVTGMSVNPLLDRLELCTWEGKVFRYEPDSIILALNDTIIEKPKPSNTYNNDEEYIHNMIIWFGDIYYTIDGRQIVGIPKVPGLYYSLWRQKLILISK